MEFILLVLFLCCSLIVALWINLRKASALPLPPSPPSDPLIGHLRFIPPEGSEEKFAEWSKVYGDVMHLRVLNRDIIILTSVEAAVDLLEKRSANYSDRPDFPIFDIMGWAPSLAFLHYGKQFRKHRLFFQEYFGKKEVEEHQHLQLTEARRLAVNLIESSDDEPDATLNRFGISVIMRVAYGHQILSNDDPYLQIAKDNEYAITHCGPPGGTPVDLFPFLQYLPSWIPGTFFAGKAREFRAAVRKLHEYPFAEVQRQMAEGTAQPSFLSRHLERLYNEGKETPEEIDDVKGAAATIYGAGADTTGATISGFMLAMTLHPECVARAQSELDSLLGGSRLPELSDRVSLPYLECLLLECYRWMSAVPLGIPHRSLADDVYRGMFIPKGALVFTNIHGIFMDETVYKDPRSFNPSRYLPKSQGGNAEPHPTSQFGFGRRICPGQYLADISLWLGIATILTLSDIKKAVAGDGTEITPIVGTTSGLTSHPKPYKSIINIRNEKAKKLFNDIKVELASGMNDPVSS